MTEQLTPGRTAPPFAENLLARLTTAAAVIGSARTADEILQVAVERAVALTGARRAVASIGVGRPPRLSVRALHPPSSRLDAGGWLKDDPDLASDLLVSRRPIRLTQSTAAANGADGAADGTSSSLLAVPFLGSDGTPIGVLELIDKEGADSFDGLDQSMTTALAQVVALALENISLLEETMTSERRLRSLLDSEPDPLLIVDSSDTILFASKPAGELFGTSPEELVDKQIDELVTVGDKERLGAVLRARADSGPQRSESSLHEMFAVRSDGTHLPIELSASVAGAGERPGQVLIAIRDASARKEAERRNASLEAELNQRKRLESVGRLAGGVAHDFNNLLAVVLNYAAFVSDELPPDSPMQADIEEIREAAKRGADLTRQLLVFSRRDAAKPEFVDLNALVVNLEMLLRRTLGEDVELVITSDPDLWAVEADPGQIEQAVVNLALNARDAMPTGGRLAIETANIAVDEDYASAHADLTPGPFVGVTVADSGVGIDIEHLDRIFEPFFSTKPSGESTGLGLATVHGIVSEANGHISVYSEPEIGSVFKLLFPAAQGTAEVVAAEIDEEPVGLGSGTILVAEDEDPVRKMVVRVLERGGYDVIAAPDGAVALELLEKYGDNVDLMLVDVVMPVMSGRELVDRAAETRPGIPVLFMSGYTEEIISAQEIVAGEVVLLEKPFTARKLLTAVQRALDSRQPAES